MAQLVLLHALGAACTLRQELECEAVCLRRLDEAATRLMERGEVLLHDPECAAPLALVREKVRMLVRQGVVARDEPLVRAARYSLLEVIARVWTLQESERQRSATAA